ncbi:MAG: hypothetical protein O3B21_14175 [Proteobacteria bacterium]|nr:hypothetical protein [Pseudomonadota bacterium]MDA1356265.1 hypothetical protein [Pseudomonadota bacterium]
MKLLSAFIVAAALSGLPLSASAEEQPASQSAQTRGQPNSCVPHKTAIDQLGKMFNEKVVGLGLGKNQKSVVELYVSTAGSWTILVTLTNGMSCIAAAGQNWTDTAAQAGLAL